MTAAAPAPRSLEIEYVSQDATDDPRCLTCGDRPGYGDDAHACPAGVAIGGATGSTYTLGDADVGGQISVQVDYTEP